MSDGIDRLNVSSRLFLCCCFLSLTLTFQNTGFQQEKAKRCPVHLWRPRVKHTELVRLVRYRWTPIYFFFLQASEATLKIFAVKPYFLAYTVCIKCGFNCIYLFILRWNSWMSFLLKVFSHKLKSSQTQVFVWFSTLIFLSTRCYSRIDSSFLVSLSFFLYG